MKLFVMFLIILIFFVGWKKHYQVKFRMNSERTGFIILRGGYRAWWIRYSEGILMTSPPKILWCFPRYEHADVRPFLRGTEARE